MSQQINDGQVAANSRQIAISGKGTYDTDDFRYSTAVKKAVRTNAFDKPSGRVNTKGETTGSATFQYLAATGGVSGAIVPAFGDQFTTTEPFGAATWTITEVGDEERKGEEAKIPVKFDLNITTQIAVS